MVGYKLHSLFFFVGTISHVPHFHTPHLCPPQLRLPLPSPGLHHTVVCMHGLWIYVLCLIYLPSLIQCSPTFPLWYLSVCSMHTCSGSILFFTLFHSLYFTYWRPRACVGFLGLAYHQSHVHCPTMLHNTAVFLGHS